MFYDICHSDKIYPYKIALFYLQKFLLELSEQQCRVGAVLEEGARLVRDQALSRDEANEVVLLLLFILLITKGLSAYFLTRF